jgi:hypothetical protein
MAEVSIETNEGAFLTTGRVEGNEIVKSDDFTYSFQSLIGNISKFSRMIFESEKNFVIGGAVSVVSGLNLSIAPVFGVCKSTGIPFGFAEELQGVTFAVTPGASDRIDILEVKGVMRDFEQQQRAFNDLDNNTITYQTIETKSGMTLDVVIKQGTAGQAPDVDAGFVKLCEIHYTANATDLYDEDIYNITSDISTEDNADWTNDEDSVYNIGYISSVNERFRQQHNEDGTHKADIIGTAEMNIGTGAGQVNGNVLPGGGTVNIPEETVSPSDSILSVLVKLAAKITTLYNAYLKFGTYGFNGVLSLSDQETSNVLVKPITFQANGNGGATIKIGSVTVLTLNENGTLTANSGYTPTNNYDLVTKSITDAISLIVSQNTSDISYILNNLDPSAASNLVLSKFSLAEEIWAATTGNISLSGEQTIDGVAVTAGKLVLVKDQTDKKENGIYQVSSGAWGRGQYTDDEDDPGVTPAVIGIARKLFPIVNGTVNGGHIFFSQADLFSVGTDDIIFADSYLSIKKRAGTLAMRNQYGRSEFAEPINPSEAATKYYVDPIVVPTASGTSISVSGPALQSNISLKLFFTGDIIGSDDSTGLSIAYNGSSPIPLMANRHGSLTALKAKKVATSPDVYKYIQAYTTIEVFYDGTQFIVMGNPIVLSDSSANSSYTVYADGFIKQSGITTTTTVQLHIPFTTTYYHVNLTKGPGSAYPLLLYLDTKTTTQFFINNYQNRYDGLWQAEGY